MRHLILRVALSVGVLVLSTGRVSAQQAQLTMYVFNEGLPVSDVEVLVDDQLVTLSDSSGLVLSLIHI